MTISLTEDWAPYELNFTASTTDDVLLNLDLGNNVEVFHFDNFVFGKTSTLLPVELAAFTAKVTKNETVSLEWTTYSETGNAYFDILRKENKGSFKTIGRLMGQGDKVQHTNYSFEDSPEDGIYYYQLKQVDFDGRFSLSAIRSVNLQTEAEIVLFPNPAGEVLRLHGWNGGLLRLYDLSGKIIFQKQFEEKRLNYDLSLSAYPKGTYFLELEGQDEKFKIIH